MWALVTELLFSFVLLAFMVISCQNVLHIASSSVRSVLAYIHTQLDRELGENEGVADEEENVTTRVVRRRVILKVLMIVVDTVSWIFLKDSVIKEK